MVDSIDYLWDQDKQFINWIKSSKFPYEYILCDEHGRRTYVYSKVKFCDVLDGIVDDVVNDPDNFDDEAYEQVYGGDYYSPPEYDLKYGATINHSVFDVSKDGVFSVDDIEMYCVGFNLSDNIYDVFRKLYCGNISDDEIYDDITDICKHDTVDVDNDQQHSIIIQFLTHQRTLPLMQPGLTQDDISDLFETKILTFNQFYQIVCENTNSNKLDEIQNFLEEYPNIIERTKKYISHCIYELQRETVPLYYTVIKQLKIIPTLDIDTLAVDSCGNLWFNPLFVQNKLIKDGDDSLLKGVLVHEAMHLIDRTQARVITAHRSAYDKATSPGASGEDVKIYQLIHEISNFAYDLIINRDVMKEGFKLPEFGIIAKKDENGHYIYEFDFTAKNDKQPDIKHVDVSKFTGEKAYHMFIGAYKYVIDKLYKQGELTQKQYEHYTNLINAIQQ